MAAEAVPADPTNEIPIGIAVGVGVAPFCTVTFAAAVPRTLLLAAKAVAEIVCGPLAAAAEFQLKVAGGVDAK
jgi:hypothetical protein